MDCASGEESARGSRLTMKIASIHQGYELYGSDRCFAESVATRREAYPAAEIEIVVPRPSPIVEGLARHASQISFEPLFVLRRKTLVRLALKGWFVLAPPPALALAARRFAGADLIHVNTSVVLDYPLVACAFPGKARAPYELLFSRKAAAEALAAAAKTR